MAPTTKYLDVDIISDILSRLPTKPLIRFRSVNKLWNSLIISPVFIKQHLSKTLSSTNRIHLITSQKSIFAAPIPVPYDPNLVFTEVLDPFRSICDTRDLNPYLITPTQTIGSSNGIICVLVLLRKRDNIIFLFNPSTRTRRFIPHIEWFYGDGHEVVDGRFGFGYDSVNDDYKLVRMVQIYGRGYNGPLIYSEVSVYSLESDSWSVVDDIPSFNICDDTRKGVFLNQGLHFIVQCKVGDGFKRVIMCFNLETHTFSFMNHPKDNVNISSRYRSFFNKNADVLCEFRGSLGMFVKSHAGKKIRVEVWVMKDYGDDKSWFRLFCNDDFLVYDDSFDLNPVVFSEDGERVLLMVSGSWAWYDWGRNRFESVIFHGWLTSMPYVVSLSVFVDTLVSLDRKHENN